MTSAEIILFVGGLLNLDDRCEVRIPPPGYPNPPVGVFDEADHILVKYNADTDAERWFVIAVAEATP